MAQKPEIRRLRRDFLRESASSVGAWTLGASYLSQASAEVQSRLSVGLIGLGSRGGTLLNWVHKLERSHNLQVTAVCDLLERRRRMAAARVQDWSGRAPAQCRTVAELCERRDVDVVLIASADFQHCYHAAQAALAGKDVYVEKPFGCDFEQVSRATALLEPSPQIVQMGTQSRGCDKYYSAAEFVQSGRLGQITYVEIAEPIFQQKWRLGTAEEPLSPDDVDWDEFLCYLPKSIPFDARRFREFRLFWPFSSGPFCQWMSHRIDLVNLVLGAAPVSAVTLGGVYLWKDGRNNPDTVETLLEYPGGVLASYHLRMGNSAHGRGITFYGTHGTLDLEAGLAFGNGGGGHVDWNEGPNGEPRARIDESRVLRSRRDGGIVLEHGETRDYLADFFDSVRARRAPRGDLQSGYDHSVACILANYAYRAGRKMLHDPSSRKLMPCAESSKDGFII